MRFFAIIATLGITLISVANAQESHYFTLNKDAGRVKKALYGGLVENKIVSSFDSSDDEDKNKKICWYGKWNGKGFLGRELSGRYTERNSEAFNGKIEIYQGPNDSPDLNNQISRFLKIYADNPDKMNAAIDSDKQTINLLILSQGEDAELSNLAQDLIQGLKRVCEAK